MSPRSSILRIVLTIFLGMSVAACQSEPSTPERAGATNSSASDAAGAEIAARDTITLTGTLIDATCHAQAAPGATAECEGKYVEAGYPVGIQTDADRESVWILVAVPQALGDYLTSTVRVTGVVRSEGVLIPHRMEVQNGSTWTSIM